MKIIGTSMNKIANTYDTRKTQVHKIEKACKKDTLEISKLGKNLSSFATKDLTSISNEKIERIRNEIKSGTYNVDSKQLAKKMLGK